MTSTFTDDHRLEKMRAILYRRVYLAVPQNCPRRICLECHEKGILLWYAK
jgi:hypothetical protein